MYFDNIMLRVKGKTGMEKRVIAIFTAFCMIIGGICLRLFFVCCTETEYADAGTHCFTVSIGNVRGEILDCRGERLTDNDFTFIAAAKPTQKAAAGLRAVLDSEAFGLAAEKMKKGNAVTADIGRTALNENEDITVMKKEIRYEKNQPARHLIGYVDSGGRGVTGIEKSFDSLLYTGKSRQVRFSADAYGRIISGAQTQLVNTNVRRGSVTLTIDRRIQIIAENALDECGVQCGGAVVLDARNGAVRAMASRPVYDTDNLADYLNADDSPMVNRGLEAYAVGSVFKIVVAAAALESGIEDFYYTCPGECEVDGVSFHCSSHKAHGELNMRKALECSCNTYFINLAQKVGAEKILEITEKLGFGQEIRLADGIVSRSGELPTAEALGKSGELANFSFGQGGFTATMLQLAQMTSAAANGGRYTEPYIIEKTETADREIKTHKSKYPAVAFSKETAGRLTEMLVSVVENGNAQKAKPDSGIKAAGKTATAQTGSFNSDGTEICNTWFCGYFPADNPEYVVVVLKQGGSSGAEDCAPVFRKIADKIYKLQ